MAYQAKARTAAGFGGSAGAWDAGGEADEEAEAEKEFLVISSQRRAPSRIASMSNPWRAEGRRPTAESSLVRPPTQSHIGKRSRKPLAVAYLSSSLATLV